jgi:hypothetical protein
MYNNDIEEEEKDRMIARLLHTLILATALIALILTLTLIWFRVGYR